MLSDGVLRWTDVLCRRSTVGTQPWITSDVSAWSEHASCCQAVKTASLLRELLPRVVLRRMESVTP